MAGERWLVCSRPEDGSFTFAGTDEPFNYIGRDVWSDGSVTYLGSDGRDYTQVFYGDTLDRMFFLTELCGNTDPFG